MKTLKIIFPYLLLLISVFIIQILSCKSKPDQQSDLSNTTLFDFLDSTQAAQRIAIDEKEQFFEYINVLDMSIQLKKNFADTTDRKIILAEYKNSLQTSVKHFSEAEEDFIKNALSNIFKKSAFDLKKVIDQPIVFIKVNGKHYGDGAYYTRENSIIIPEKKLRNPDSENFEQVIEHEIFHIYSRYHPEKQKSLYALIGYKSIGNLRNLQMNQRLRARVLLNPDGINYAYAIQLKDESKTFQAIPLIISKKEKFDVDQEAFFDYLQFDLYKIQPPFSRLIKVESTTAGESIINYEEQPAFLAQIGENTDYIIHPDEVLADNFVLLLNGEQSWDQLSPRGQEILKEMKKIIFE